MPGKRHSCGNSGILEDRKYWKICKWVCFHKMSKPVLCKWNAWKVQIWSQRLAQVCEINLCGSNLALQRASDLILEGAIPASVSCLFIYFFIFISFCIAFVHSSLLSNFLGPLRLKGVFAWLPELSVVIQTGQKLLKRAVRYFFPVYSTVYTLLQSLWVSQCFPENVMWRMVPVRKEMEGLC